MADKPLSRGEIFVVDDDPAIRATLSVVLSTGGYQVLCFADGAALLAVARTRAPSCILLDVHLPGKSGLDILRELQGEDYPAPIFMISGRAISPWPSARSRMARSTLSKSRFGAAKSLPGWMRRSAHIHAGRRRISRRISRRLLFPAAQRLRGG